MSLVAAALRQRRMILTVSALATLSGFLYWRTMPRQEDPQLPRLWGQVVAVFPGADAESMERLVLEPLEDHLSEVDAIHELDSTVLPGLAVVKIELLDVVDSTGEAWDDVREALVAARPELPAEVADPILADDLDKQESIVLALSGSDDPLVLVAAARRLRHELLALAEVAEVRLVADPGEQVTIRLDDATARRHGLDARSLAALLAARNSVLPGGSLRVDDRTVLVRPQAEFRSVDEIRQTPIPLATGAAVPLEEIAAVEHGPTEPATSRMRHRGARVVGLGIVPRERINVLAFGAAVRARVEALAPAFAPVAVDEVVFQPDRVERRLDDLGASLLSGIVVVAGLLLVTMGLRLGLIVSSVIPLVALTSLAAYALGGGVLQQISIAALIIALGMLVDNAIVVAENVQRRLDDGDEPEAAALGAVRELATPLAGATGTTIAAFLPMLMATGVTAEFTRAIPIVLMVTLSLSYLFAVLVTPLLSALLLRRRGGDAGNRWDRVAAWLGRIATTRSTLVLTTAVVMVVTSFGLLGSVRRSFFPLSDRNQLIVVGSSRVDLQACKLEYSIVSPK